MPKEIEKKFLVHKNLLPELRLGREIRQGYLADSPVVRVRVVTFYGADAPPPKGLLTVKGPGTEERDEFEYPIPAQHAETMLDMCPSVMSKSRFHVLVGGKVWEVDYFHGPLYGLVLAEIELTSKGEGFMRPNWIRKDVTHEPGFANVNLVKFGIPREYISELAWLPEGKSA